MKRRIIIGVALVVLALLGGLMAYGFFVTHERVEEEFNLGPDPEAVVNPMLAAERFFERLDMDVHTEPNPHETQWLDDTDVLVLDPQMLIYGGFRDHLLGWWLEEGGHLIILSPEEADDEFISELALVRYLDWHEYELDGPQTWPDHIEANREIIRAYDEVDPDEDFDWDAMGDLEQILEYESLFWSTEVWGPSVVDFIATTREGDPIFMSVANGEGRITVLTRDEWLMNPGMGVDGMGQVWADLLATGEEWPEQAAFFVRQHPEGWMTRLFKAGWPFFAGLLLWLVFGFTRGRRFGPTVPEPERRRQRRGDHIRATGHFLWDHHGRDVLVDATRRALVEALQKRRPSIKTMNPSQRYRVMAEELQIEVYALRELMDGPVPRRQADFQTLIARLERLRRNL